MKLKKFILPMFGIVGAIIIIASLFLPFVSGQLFAGNVVTSNLYDKFGILIILLLAVGIALAAFKLYKFILLPLFGILGLAGVELFIQLSIAYDQYSEYRSMMPSVGFYLIASGIVFVAIFALLTKKTVKTKQVEDESTMQSIIDNISPLAVKEHTYYSYQAPIVASELNLPPELSEDELLVEENTIKIPIINNEETNISLPKYDTNFDIVRETASILKKEEIKQKPIPTDDDNSWELGDTITNLNEDVVSEDDDLIINIDQILKTGK